jgi:hypothetical protein
MLGSHVTRSAPGGFTVDSLAGFQDCLVMRTVECEHSTIGVGSSRTYLHPQTSRTASKLGPSKLGSGRQGCPPPGLVHIAPKVVKEFHNPETRWAATVSQSMQCATPAHIRPLEATGLLPLWFTGFLQGFKPTAAGGEGHTFARSTAASRALVRLSMVRLVRPSSLSGLNEARQFFNRNRIVSKRIRLLGRTSI